MEGVQVDTPDTTSNWTPLLRAASVGGNRDVAEILLKYKADPNKLDKDKKRCFREMFLCLFLYFRRYDIFFLKPADDRCNKW